MIIKEVDLIDITVLKFVHLFKFYDKINLSLTSTELTVTFLDDSIIGDVSDKIEEHMSYALNFPAGTSDLVFQNAKIVLSKAISDYLDYIAGTYGYDNIASARSYAGFVNPFQDEALRLSKWSADCWVTAGQIASDVQNGLRTMPTSSDEIIAELPDFSTY